MSADLHETLVNAMVEGVGRSIPELLREVHDKHPEATQADFKAAMKAAADDLREQAEQDEAELEALENLAPLFEGMPVGMELGECARLKAEQGDPLALAFLEWEKQQAGGVQ